MKNGSGTSAIQHLATLPGALPYELHPEGAEHGVLLIHGYTGRPKDLRYQADRLVRAGFAVSVPRLPGAGTDMNDLAAATRRDWRRRCFDAYLDLKSCCRRVSLLGYSMGGLLALDLASRVCPEHVVLLAPGIKTSNRLLSLAPILAPVARFIPDIETDWMPLPDDDEETREHGRRYWAHRDIRSASQLVHLKREVRRKLPRISTPISAVVSTGDNAVPLSALNLLEKSLPNGLENSLVVSRCSHDLPQGADKERIAEAVVAWLSE